MYSQCQAVTVYTPVPTTPVQVFGLKTLFLKHYNPYSSVQWQCQAQAVNPYKVLFSNYVDSTDRA